MTTNEEIEKPDNQSMGGSNLTYTAEEIASFTELLSLLFEIDKRVRTKSQPIEEATSVTSSNEGETK